MDKGKIINQLHEIRDHIAGASSYLSMVAEEEHTTPEHRPQWHIGNLERSIKVLQDIEMEIEQSLLELP